VKIVREGSGLLVLLGALAVLFQGILALRGHDFVSAIVLSVVGLALLGASVELLRPSVGE
tara:strand:- start:2060 stop:2239 length:180 start_codon:yes stop_codon:yes gene_type:complete